MRKEKMNEAFSKLRASEDLRKEVFAMDNMKKQRNARIVGKMLICAAILVLLLAVGVFGKASPYFMIEVHAGETDTVELGRKGETFFVPAYDGSDKPPRGDDPTDRPIFDAYVTEDGKNGGKIFDGSRFRIDLWLNDETKQYDQLSIFVDGQLVKEDFDAKAMSFYLSEDGEEKGRRILVRVEETTRVDLILYADNGSVLQHYGMVVTPVEGGWSVTLDESYLAFWGSQFFSGWL